MKKLYSLIVAFAFCLTMLAQDNHAGVRYDGTITINMYGIPTVLENQSVYIVNAPDGKSCDFFLYDFSLDGQESLGDIDVNNVTITDNGGVKEYLGAREGLQLGEGEGTIYADCTLDGTEQPDGTMLMNIHVKWLMVPGDHSYDVPIEVIFAGKKAAGQTSGINDVIDSEASVVGIYSVDGKELAAPSKGLNIIVYSNGNVVKTVVR